MMKEEAARVEKVVYMMVQSMGMMRSNEIDITHIQNM